MASESQEVLKTIEHYSYRPKDQIGKGFSSIVYRGLNNQSGSAVAIKVIDLRKLSQKTMHELLESEIGIIKSIAHPNLLYCEDVFITINNCYIVTELCRGGDLASEIKKKGRFRGLEALKLMLEIGRGFAHLSELNIIHRDIKPANILLHNGTAKIADFGFARVEKGEGRKEKYNVGTPLYMSPEAFTSSYYSKQSDIWSLGIVFYEILQGRTPWEPKNEIELRAILKERKQPIFRIAIRDELETIIKGCLSFDRQQRISIQSIIQTLEQMMDEMMKEENLIYRETLTRRPNTNSCRSLLPNNKPAGAKDAEYSKGTPCSKENVLHKISSETDSGKETQLVRNRTAVNLSLEPSIQEASRSNHSLLKAGINFGRLIYKIFPRVQKLICPEPIKWTIQAEMVAALEFVIQWLRVSIQDRQKAADLGLKMHEQFRETRCYAKTLMVIEEYSERYKGFSKKMRKFLANRRCIPTFNSKDDFKTCAIVIASGLNEIQVLNEVEEEHNSGLDFSISMVVLMKMLGNHSLEFFSRSSHVETIIETVPARLEEGELEGLRAKKELVCKA